MMGQMLISKKTGSDLLNCGCDSEILGIGTEQDLCVRAYRRCAPTYTLCLIE